MRRLMTVVIVAALLSGCAGSDPEPPPADTTSDNPSVAIADCLREKGWSVTAHSDNSVSAEFPSEQMDQYQADYDACVDEVQPEQPRPPMTEQQAEAYFDALLDVVGCVRGLGYQVAEPPSRQAAVEALQQDIIDLGWDPYEDPTLNAGSRDEIDEVYRECPQPSLP